MAAAAEPSPPWTYPSDLKFELPGTDFQQSCRLTDTEMDADLGPKFDGPNKIMSAMCQIPKGTINIRGPNYLEDAVKIPHTEPAFRCFAVFGVTYKEPIQHISARWKALKDFFAAHPDHEFFVNNRLMPSEPPQMVIELHERPKGRTSSKEFETLWKKYKEGDDEFKNQHFKFIPTIPNAGWMMKSAVGALGGFRPVILGRKYLKQYHYSGANYIENDLDIGSSRVARSIVGLITAKLGTLIIDQSYVIEAKEQVDLPEVVLAGCRGVRMVMDQISSPLTDDMLLDVPVQPMVKRDGEEGGSESGGSKKEKKKKKKK